jgi:pyruvate/2-oxoglutarate dehydrogenase complex dihydrolipoamide dehydrogenase (E3) component
VTSIEGALGDLRVAVRGPDRVGHVLRVARLLAATGRRPALAGLGLANAGVKLDDHGAPVVDAALRTSNRRVWLAGDAVGGIELTPVANLEGERIARSLLSGREQRIDLSAMPTACFSIPEVAQVGITEEQAQARGLAYTVGRDDFRYTAQAIIGEQTEGLVKIVAGKDDRVLGAAIAGAHASELIYPFALAVGTRMTAGQIASLRAVHPSYSEALNWAAGAVPEEVELEKAA